LYAERTFQRDRYFPFVAFNHEQIRGSSTGGFLLTKRSNFKAVAQKILSVDKDALQSLIDRGTDGGIGSPNTPEERQCMEILSLINYVSARVPGSFTQRRFQRSEIKALIMAYNVPMFFVTFAPTDFKNPLCLYYCGESIDLSETMLDIPACRERLNAIATNPVACAHFFDLVVRSFVEHVLRVDNEKGRDGLFGRTSTYYGTVE
ncbi:hypothetical protein C8Q79DRAFT_873717, partial [Trametes meyenii]